MHALIDGLFALLPAAKETWYLVNVNNEICLNHLYLVYFIFVRYVEYNFDNYEKKKGV